MFERRHYNAIASLLADIGREANTNTDTHRDIVDQLSNLFKGDNENFRPKFFLKASGVVGQ